MKSLLIILFTLVSGNVLAQEAPADSVQNGTSNQVITEQPAITPKSPTVAALGRYGEYPVSLYTGLPSIEIPIHQFTVGGVTVPIKLTYHASGIKVNDLPSWVGMGWSLQTGGMITRSVLSRPDEQGSGSLGQAFPNPSTFYDFSCLTTSVDQQMNSLANNLVDTQRDLFSYSIPTASNTFMLTPSAPGYSSLQPGMVRVAAVSGLDSFIITDESGTQYRFADKETTVTNPTTPNAFGDFVSAWHLSEITSPTNADRAVYTYAAPKSAATASERIDSWVVNAELDESFIGDSGVQTGAFYTGNQDVGSSVFTRLLASIEFPGGKLVFVKDNMDQLDYIDVMGYNVSSNTYNRIKRVDLVYTYKSRTGNSNTQVPFLDQVKLVQSDGATSIGSYQLTYNETSLPEANSTAKDYWGYYNGKPNNTLLESRTISFAQRANNPSITTTTIGDADRKPSEVHMKAWSLTSIRYPTGGLTQFDFEANRYKVGQNTILAGGLRLAGLRNYAANNQLAQTKAYKYGQDEEGTGTFRSQAGQTYVSTLQLNYNQFAGTSSPYNYRYRTYNYTSAPTGPLTPDEGSPVTYPEVAEYTLNAEGIPIGKIIYRYRDEAQDAVLQLGVKLFVTSTRWNRGQLTSQRWHNAAGNLVAQTDYDYTILSNGATTDLAGVLVQQVTRQIGSVSVRPNTSCQDPANMYVPRTYTFSYGLVKPTRIRETLIDMANAARKTVRVTEMDYAPSSYLIRETRRFVEGGIAGNDILGERVSYPQDYGTQIPLTAPSPISPELLGIRALQERNIFRPVETINYRQEGSTGTKKYLTGSLTTFKTKTINGQLTALPYQTYLAETEGTNSYVSSADRYQSSGGTGTGFLLDPIMANPRMTMSDYDANGNLTGYQLKDGSSTGYTYTTYQPTSGIPFSVVTSQTLNADQPSAQMTSYSYTLPVLGPTSQTDTRGVMTSYLYDAFGRLQTVKDKDGRVLKQYTYHYSTQP
ncbi:RHS repeat protein [Fibrella forsythiae]|uniref:RHS repeat protein n=1 Tax=Fibrella forsythiae TaxID=2817061 RepID=A0ABS3JKT7_9BACT|nr:RHS repeat protein [Fibrella forsythiae]MBO0950619.1 RHS repeat protein [Fibrella forsythiae]